MMSQRGIHADAPRRYWPPHDPPEGELGVETCCARCDQPWRIHRDLSGYRLRCICGGWVRVPYPEALVESARLAAGRRGGAPAAAIAAPGEETTAPRSSGSSTPVPSSRGIEGSRPAPLVDSQALEFAERREVTEPTAREIDRGLIELLAIVVAFLVPPTVVLLSAGPDTLFRWLPIVSLVGGVMVLLVGLASGQFGFEGFRGARARFFAESAALAAISIGLAHVYGAFLIDSGLELPDTLGQIIGELGLPLTLFTVSLCPAVFEEIAFRGIVQGRMLNLLGTRQGLLVTATLFAVAHGVSVFTPVHLILGLYLGALRLRSGSLIPGMLFHGMYNGGVILLAA